MDSYDDVMDIYNRLKQNNVNEQSAVALTGVIVVADFLYGIIDRVDNFDQGEE